MQVSVLVVQKHTLLPLLPGFGFLLCLSNGVCLTSTLVVCLAPRRAAISFWDWGEYFKVFSASNAFAAAA